MLNKKNIYVLLMLVAFSAIFCFAFIYFNKSSSTDTANEQTEMRTTSENLIASFIKNEHAANNKFVERILEVDGVIKDITFENGCYSIILQVQDNTTYIICEMKTDQNKKIESLKKNNEITIKGICKGFLMDVILLDCIFADSYVNES